MREGAFPWPLWFTAEEEEERPASAEDEAAAAEAEAEGPPRADMAAEVCALQWIWTDEFAQSESKFRE
jgi:hypothetical protein